MRTTHVPGNRRRGPSASPPRPYPGDTFIHLGLISTNVSQHLWLRRARSLDWLYPLEDLPPLPASVSHP